MEDSAPDFFIQDCLLHEAVCYCHVIPSFEGFLVSLSGTGFIVFFSIVLFPSLKKKNSIGTHTLNC